jgi:hypothetical protein
VPSNRRRKSIDPAIFLIFPVAGGVVGVVVEVPWADWTGEVPLVEVGIFFHHLRETDLEA